MAHPTTVATHVPHDQLQRFVYDAARLVDIPEEQATLLAELLIANDLRGVLTHGSRQILRYAHEIRSDKLNPRPRVQCFNETPTSVVMDGDGGLGYFPAYEGTQRVIEKAREHGMAAMVSRNHGHIGAAGIYSRLAVEADMLAFTTSGVQLSLNPGDPLHKAAGGSPISFGVPTGEAPPLIVDAGVTHDVQGASPHRDEITRLAPRLVLRAIAYGTICQTWGGFLAGVPIDPARANRRYPAANQGAMLFACKVSLFTDLEQFKREVDEYAQRVRQMTPVEGTEGAFLPGAVEAHREQIYRRTGVPLSPEHQADLEKLADELSLAVPWR